jgi:hypothetical protein
VSAAARPPIPVKLIWLAPVMPPLHTTVISKSPDLEHKLYLILISEPRDLFWRHSEHEICHITEGVAANGRATGPFVAISVR